MLMLFLYTTSAKSSIRVEYADGIEEQILDLHANPQYRAREDKINRELYGDVAFGPMENANRAYGAPRKNKRQLHC